MSGTNVAPGLNSRAWLSLQSTIALVGNSGAPNGCTPVALRPERLTKVFSQNRYKLLLPPLVASNALWQDTLLRSPSLGTVWQLLREYLWTSVFRQSDLGTRIIARLECLSSDQRGSEVRSEINRRAVVLVKLCCCRLIVSFSLAEIVRVAPTHGLHHQ